MVERADQGEVLELRSTAVAPPPDVVRLGESSHPTAREATLAIAITDLAEHPRGRLSPGAPQPDHVAQTVFQHDLRSGVQSARRTEAGWSTGPSSTSQPPLPSSRPLACAWITTVARSGSPSTAMRAEHIATSASARRASAPLVPSSSGMAGMVRATRSSARATTAPSAAGSSASSAKRRPSSKYHQPTDRARAGPTTSSIVASSSRSPLRRIASHETRRAHTINRSSDPGVANRVISTTLSMPSAPLERACASRGRCSSAKGGGDPTARLPVREPVADREEVRGIARALLAPRLRAHEADDRGQELAVRRPHTRVSHIHGTDERRIEHTFVP